MPQLPNVLAASAYLLPLCTAFSVTTTGDAQTLANSIFGQGITILQANFSGASIATGTFVDGPFGIGSGGLLTTGAAVGGLPDGDHYVNNGAPGSDQYCGANTFNAAILTADIVVDSTYSGINVEFIMTSEEEGGSADPIGIFVDKVEYARDPDGTEITALSPYLAQPFVIVPPNAVTSYPGSTPPLLVGIPLSPGLHTVVIAICDQSDAEWDSGLLIKAQGCTECDPIKINYVTTTTTVPAGEIPYTSTTKASGTQSGTVEVGVTAEDLPTTTEETTSTSEGSTASSSATDSASASTTASEAITHYASYIPAAQNSFDFRYKIGK